jgi:hypothetical protein
MNVFKQSLKSFIAVENTFGYDFEAQQIIDRNLNKIKDRKSLMKVYSQENLAFDYMDNPKLLKIWNTLITSVDM